MYFLFINICEEFVDKFMYSNVRDGVGKSRIFLSSSGSDSPTLAPGDRDSGPVHTSSNHQHNLAIVHSATDSVRAKVFSALKEAIGRLNTTLHTCPLFLSKDYGVTLAILIAVKNCLFLRLRGSYAVGHTGSRRRQGLHYGCIMALTVIWSLARSPSRNYGAQIKVGVKVRRWT